MSKKTGEKDRLSQILVPIFTSNVASKIGQISLVEGVGSSDDCAVIDVGDTSLLIGMDYIRGTGFSLFQNKLLNYFDIGYFLAIANLSDLAAMGADPLALLTIFRYSEGMTDEEFRDVLLGVKEACDLYGAEVIGGDIGGADNVVLGATAIGYCPRGEYLLRRNALPGDLICVTGFCGLACSARIYFEVANKAGLKLSSDREAALLNSWKRPIARIKEGKLIRDLRIASACQDVSDGVKTTIEEICKASNVGAVLDEDAIPVHPVTKQIAEYFNIPLHQIALSASVDFNLIFTLHPDILPAAKKAFQTSSLDFGIIGEITKETQLSLRTSKGQVSLPGVGWESQFDDINQRILGLKK